MYLAAARGVEAARRDATFFRLCGVRRMVGVPLTEGMQQNFYGAATGGKDHAMGDGTWSRRRRGWRGTSASWRRWATLPIRRD